MPRKQTIRFWQFIGCEFIRIKLTDGVPVEHQRHARHCEGWASEWHRWEYDAAAGVVRMEVVEDGRDCDGRLTTGDSFVCPVDQLAAFKPGYPDDSGYLPAGCPKWQREESWQRDEYAEAMGY